MMVNSFSPLKAHCCDKIIMEIKQEFKKPISQDELLNIDCELSMLSRIAIECPVCKLWLMIGGEPHQFATGRYKAEFTPAPSLSK
jgi:hypothetical protein